MSKYGWKGCVKLYFDNIQSSHVEIWMERVCEMHFYNMHSCDVEILIKRLCEIAFV